MTWVDVAHVITWLGDPRLLLAFSTLWVAALRRSHRDALAKAWLRALLLCLLMVVASKMTGYTLALRTTDNPFLSLSGHSAFAAFFYLSGAAVARRAGRDQRRILTVAAVVTVGAVAWSRLALRYHTIWEILAGAAVGVAAAVLFARSRAEDTVGLGIYQAGFAAAVAARITAGLTPMRMDPMETLVQRAGVFLGGAFGILPPPH